VAFQRSPKGVYVRSSPDLYQGNCAWGSVVGSAAGSAFEDGGILNLDNLGRVMLVWGVCISIAFPNITNHPSAAAIVGYTNGDEGALSPSALTPFNPLSGNFTSKVWDQPTGTGELTSNTILPALQGAGNFAFFPNYPIAAIPTGWSIGVALQWIVGAASIDWGWSILVEFVGPQP
jgi:hypothetical protein